MADRSWPSFEKRRKKLGCVFLFLSIISHQPLSQTCLPSPHYITCMEVIFWSGFSNGLEKIPEVWWNHTAPTIVWTEYCKKPIGKAGYPPPFNEENSFLTLLLFPTLKTSWNSFQRREQLPMNWDGVSTLWSSSSSSSSIGQRQRQRQRQILSDQLILFQHLNLPQSFTD